jgi:primosomal protein N'
MHVVSVIPISRGIHVETLTYFTAKKNVMPGMIVQVPLRGRTVAALVEHVAAVADAKSFVKNADFALRKLGPQSPAHLLSPAFARALRKCARYHAATLGSVMASTVPAPILAHASELASAQTLPDTKHALAADTTVLVAEYERRLDHYRNLIRESFAHKKSICIIVPSRREALAIYAAVKKGIEEYMFVFTGALSSKEFCRRFTEARTHPHPIALIGTPPTLAVARHDLHTIIIERESAHAYVERTRPFVDYRILAEAIAEESGGRIIFADMTLRTTTYARYQHGDLAEITRVPKRIALPAKTEIVDMRTYKASSMRTPFVIMGNEMRDALALELARDGRAFVYVARRGIAATTVCLDCGTTKTCPQCETPMVLHKTATGNVFVCHTCALIRPSEERCRQCQSWRLQSFGLGTERVAAELTAAFPEACIAVIDADHAVSDAEATRVATTFARDSKQILIGTERAVGYLPERIGSAAVASIDSLLALPEWNGHERIFSLLLRLREKCEHTLVIQTRQPDISVLTDVTTGNLLSMYERELSERKRFRYPPYATLIRIDAIAGRGKTEPLITQAERVLAPWGCLRAPRTVALPNGMYRDSLLVRLINPWPDDALYEALRMLPPSVTAHIDPDSVI